MDLKSGALATNVQRGVFVLFGEARWLAQDGSRHIQISATAIVPSPPVTPAATGPSGPATHPGFEFAS